MASIKNHTLIAGENATLTMEARDRSNAPLSLSGSSVSWRVGRGPTSLDSSWPLFTKSAAVVSAAAGTFSVALSLTDTRYMQGDYTHQAWVTNASAQSYVVAEGRLRVKPWIES